MIKKFLTFGSYLTLLVAFFGLLFFAFTQHSIWFDYVSLEPTKDTFTIGEPVTMISYMERKKKNLTLEFYDVLRCVESGRMIGKTDIGSFDKKQKLKQVKWNFKGTLENNGIPSVPDTCVMESTITHKVFGVFNARQVIISGKIHFK